MRIFLLLLFFCWSGNALTEVYKWVDQDGVHYGDKPPSKEAEPVKLPEVSGYKPRQLPSLSSKPAAQAPTNGEEKPFSGYQQLKITSPANDETLRANDGVVQVAMSLVPELQEGHELTLFLDGKPVPAEGGVTSLMIKGVERGSHMLSAVVNDAQGKQLIRAVSVRFFLHKASLLQWQGPENGDDNGTPVSPVRRAPAAPRAPVYAPRHTP